MHKQCTLVRGGRDTEKAFISAEHAIPGKYVRIKQDGEWTNGWLVAEAFEPALPSDLVQARSGDYRNHRKATDI